MKTKIIIIISLFSFKLFSQTITYANFSAALTATINANIAANASFNSSLTTVAGNGVTWNASGLTVQSGTPLLHLSFANPSGTPYGALYPTSNYVEYDPALTAIISYNYYLMNADSIVTTGSYDPNSAHEIFQNYDKHLIFPFALGQTFTDSYYKTNYSNSSTISSYQSGSRTVTYTGFGTLILPQGTFSHVALISESRTNSLGPASYEYTWYDVSNGKKLLYRSENNGSVITIFCADISSGLHEISPEQAINIYPHPITDESVFKIESSESLANAVLKIVDEHGVEVKSFSVKDNEIILKKDEFGSGIKFYKLYHNNERINSGKLIFQ